MSANNIKRRVSMADLVAHYGITTGRNHKIICPFHDDKNPSLHVYTEPGRGWYCFTCGFGGSVIDFVMRYEQVGFRDACRLLSEWFGIERDADPRATYRRKFEQHNKKNKEQSLLDRFIKCYTILNSDHDGWSKELEWACKNVCFIDNLMGD